MATSIIDGTLTEIVAGRSMKNKFTIYKSLTFQRDDGSTEVLKRQVVRPEIADLLKPGASGRFYAFKAVDMKGVHGVRLDDGTSVYAYHASNLKLFPILGAVNLAWIVLMVFTRDSVPMLGVLVLALSIFGFFATRRSMAAAKLQFDTDDGSVVTSSAKGIARAVTSTASET